MTTHVAAAPRRASWRLDIQALRGYAVLLVVLSHIGVPGLAGGYVGVDVFFVMSGFLITGHLMSRSEKLGRVDFWAFYAARVKRLAVPAALVVAVTVVAYVLIGSPLQMKSVTTDAVAASTYTINYFMGLQEIVYQDASKLKSPFVHYWSLAVEEQFYVVWPFLIALSLWVGRRVPRLSPRGVALTFIGVVCLGSLAWSVATSVTDPSLAYFGLHTRAFELGAGAMLALWAPRIPAGLARFRTPLTALVLGAVIASAVVFDENTVFPGVAALWPVLGTAGLLYLGCERADGSASKTPWLLNNRVMLHLGDVSYAFYLWHWPVLVAPTVLFNRQVSWWQGAGLMLIAYVLAAMTTYVLERRVRAVQWQPRRWLAAGVALIVMATGVAGAARWWNASTALDGSVLALSPRIDRAMSETPSTTSDGCHVGYDETELRSCVYGDPQGTTKVVLVGDSHAQQWFPAVEAAARERGVALYTWTKSACPIADVVPYNLHLRTSYEKCGQWRDQVMARVVELRPDVVIASQSNALADDGTTAEEWVAATQRTLDALGRGGASVVFVGDTPTVDVAIPHCLALHGTHTGDCDFARRTQHQHEAELTAALHEALHLKKGEVVDPLAWWCGEERCPAVVSDTMTYRDSNHISPVFSATLAPHFSELLSGAPQSS